MRRLKFCGTVVMLIVAGACSEAHEPRLLTGLPTDVKSAHRTLDERLAKSFPRGLAEAELVRNLRVDGFEISPSRAEFCQTAKCATYVKWNKKEMLGQQWNVEWTLDAAKRLDRIWSSGAILN